MNNEVWYEADGKRINLLKATRLYPAVLISVGGESASVSLEWAEMKADVVTVECYLLVCDFDPIGELPQNRVELRFESKDALIGAMQDISGLLNT